MAEEPPVNPFSTGGGGTRFELLVAVHYIADMLLDQVPRGRDAGPVRAIKLQQRNQGYLVDDVILICDGTPEPTLAIQVKHAIRYAEADEAFVDAIAQCWRQFRSDKFDSNRDRIGIGHSDTSNTAEVRTHIPELLDWARTSDTAASFVAKCERFNVKKKYLGVFRKVLAKAAQHPVSDEEVWRFLRVLVVLWFEFDRPEARDATSLLNNLRRLVRNREPRQAAALASILFDAASAVAKSGGEMTVLSLRDRLPADVQARLPAAAVEHARSTTQRLREQVERQLTKQKNSRKYIRAVFVESQGPKDLARAFCNPLLFYKKALEQFDITDTSYLNLLLSKVRIPPLRLDAFAACPAPPELKDLVFACDKLINFCDEKLKAVKNIRDWRDGKGKKLESRIPKERKYIAQELRFNLPGWVLESALSKVRKLGQTLKGGVLLLRSPAGQGKTNFVCNLAEVLLAYEIPCLFWTGKDLGQYANGELADRLILPEDLGSLSKEEWADSLRHICEARGAPLVILIDAINEHPNIPGFAERLESAIATLLGYGFVRLILTCRAEYFEHRFANLEKSSFADKVHYLDGVHEQMDETASERMLDGYLKFFRIQANFSPTASARLQRDPFLLRIYCEAYGSPGSPEIVVQPYQADIYKDQLFTTYLSRRFDELLNKRVERGQPKLGSAQLYRGLLMKMAAAMVSADRFDFVPVTALAADDHAIAEDLLHEDVIIRKDIVLSDSKGSSDEVIAFPFDELRDYVIAQYLLTLYNSAAPANFIEAVRKVVQASHTAAEGVARFLFYASKRQSNDGLQDVLEKEPWFEENFLDCIFGVEDALVTDQDIVKVRNRFLASEKDARRITQGLLFRARTDASPRLNLALLVELFRELNEEKFHDWITPLFDSSGDRYFGAAQVWYPIEKLASSARNAIERSLTAGDDESSKSLTELLLYLIHIQGPEYTEPARAVMLALAAGQHRQFVIAKVLLPRLRDARHPQVAVLWDLVGDLVRATRIVDGEVLDAAMTLWRGLKPGDEQHARLNTQLLDFFDSAQTDAGQKLPEDVDNALQASIQTLDEDFDKWFPPSSSG